MAVATVSTKGQITLPVQIRKELGIRPHDKVTIESSSGSIVIRRARDFFEWEGFLGKGFSAEEEREAMLRGAMERVMGDDE